MAGAAGFGTREAVRLSGKFGQLAAHLLQLPDSQVDAWPTTAPRAGRHAGLDAGRLAPP